MSQRPEGANQLNKVAEKMLRSTVYKDSLPLITRRDGVPGSRINCIFCIYSENISE